MIVYGELTRSSCLLVKEPDTDAEGKDAFLSGCIRFIPIEYLDHFLENKYLREK
jgi:hypothetical protein